MFAIWWRSAADRRRYFGCAGCAPELHEILLRLVKRADYRLSGAARSKAATILTEAATTAGPAFGNARAVRNLFEDAIALQATRVIEAGTVDDESIFLYWTPATCPIRCPVRLAAARDTSPGVGRDRRRKRHVARP
ncbi:MAG: hypothetical protein ACLP0J_27040 [Solirubrobacteraceae bacterium]